MAGKNIRLNQWSKEVALVAFGGISLFLMLHHHVEVSVTNIVGFVLSVLFVSFVILREIRKGQGNVVRFLVVLFLLAALGTAIFAAVAKHYDWIDSSGKPMGVGGDFVMKLIDFMLNIKADFKLILFFAALMGVLHIVRWILDDRFGYKTVPRPKGIIRRVLSTIFIGAAKSFVVVAGVLIPLAVYIHSWGQFNTSQLIGGQLLGMSLIVVGLIFLWFNEQVCCVLDDAAP